MCDNVGAMDVVLKESDWGEGGVCGGGGGIYVKYFGEECDGQGRGRGGWCGGVGVWRNL